MSKKQYPGGILLIAAVLACLLASSGCGGSASATTLGSGGNAPGIDELQDFLYAEFERLGIDPSKTGSQAPTGDANMVFDLSAALVDPDGEGPEDPTGIELSWTEQLIGDYDQNGEVGMSDLTPIAINYGLEVGYDDESLHSGISYWPSGDPNGLGVSNWRLARVDGDGNGEINLADITSIAQHWGERLDGYTLYKNGPLDSEYTALPSSDDPESMLTIPRSSTYADGSNTPDPSKPVRYRYTIELEGFGDYDFQLGSLDDIEDMEGSLSFAQSFEYNEPPIADLSVTPNHGAAPLPVTFDASGSVDNNGEIVLYEWDFDGDGTFDFETTEPSTGHTYEAPGTFSAVVQVTDDAGATDSATTAVVVFSNAPPVVELSAIPIAGSAPLFVTFYAGGSIDPIGEELSFDWDFDGDGVFGDWDGTDPLSPTAQHLYLAAGVFEATVKCTNESGAWDTASVEIQVNAIADGLYIAPDPVDLDWLDVVGSGVQEDPYVLAVTDGYNSDLTVEFGLVVHEFSNGSWREVDVAELEWTSWPPFIVDWVAPGVFMANLFTSEHIYALRLEPEGVSNFIYVVAQVLPES